MFIWICDDLFIRCSLNLPTVNLWPKYFKTLVEEFHLKKTLINLCRQNIWILNCEYSRKFLFTKVYAHKVIVSILLAIIHVGLSNMEKKNYLWKAIESKFDGSKRKTQMYIKIIMWIWLENQLFYLFAARYYWLNKNAIKEMMYFSFCSG